MGIAAVFSLIVLVVAVVCGDKTARKLYRTGIWIGVACVALVAIIAAITAINQKAPTNQGVQFVSGTTETASHPLPIDNTVVGIDPRVATAPQYQQQYQPPAAAAPQYQPPVPQAPVYAPPPQAIAPQYAASLPAPAPVAGGKPHFGFGYAPMAGYIRVTDVYPGGPAYDAGIIPGMGVLAIDGARVRGVDDVWQAQNQRHHIGDIVPFVFGDLNGTTKAVNVRLGSDAEPWGVNINR